MESNHYYLLPLGNKRSPRALLSLIFLTNYFRGWRLNINRSFSCSWTVNCAHRSAHSPKGCQGERQRIKHYPSCMPDISPFGRSLRLHPDTRRTDPFFHPPSEVIGGGCVYSELSREQQLTQPAANLRRGLINIYIPYSAKKVNKFHAYHTIISYFMRVQARFPHPADPAQTPKSPSASARTR